MEPGLTCRILDQEIDTIEVCPNRPEYVAVGTYSLLKNEQQPEPNPEETDEQLEGVKSSSRRVGSIQILPIVVPPASLTERDECYISRRDFDCAILDIHFHPADPTLLGAATSTGGILFLRILWQPQTAGSIHDEVQIILIGKATVSSQCNGVDNTLPLVTQFAWIYGENASQSKVTGQNNAIVHLAACDTTGQTKLLRVNIPSSPQTAGDEPTDRLGGRLLPCKITDLHTHLYNLEAWTVSVIDLPKASSAVTSRVFLSGGDDSCLIASKYAVALPTATVEDEEGLEQEASGAPPVRIILDKSTHSSGVVSILPLSPLPDGTIPILTGSYDQFIRLFLFDPKREKHHHVSQLELDGGVWRITLLDTYPQSRTVSDSSSHGDEREWVLLVSAMHGGCYIIRLARLVKLLPDTAQDVTWEWSWAVEKLICRPHESMVYACAAVRDEQTRARWTIISSSFYDKRLCVWEWMDRHSIAIEKQVGCSQQRS